MKKTLHMIAATASLVLLTNCTFGNSNSHQNDSIQSSTAVSSDFYGTYQGTLPAADCAGIRTTLTLNKDTTYELVKVYLTENEQEFVTNGVYERQGNDVIVLITPSSGEKAFYKLSDNAVTVLDQEGKDVEGSLAHLYVLKKQ